MLLLERCLRRWSLAICLGLALLIAGLLSGHGIVGPDAMPFGDGQAYAVRAFTLYGYLHSGQWGAFWNLLTLNRTNSLMPLHDWLFFLLPQSWASVTAYGVILGLTNYLLLAFGIWALCRALEREAWAPALFLLCASQNISIDFSYFYFCDIPFFALGTVALAAQLEAWRKNRFRASVLSGALAALLFFVKPANAGIFCFTYVLAEFTYAGLQVWRARRAAPAAAPPLQLRRHLAGVALGFLPILMIALACGGWQTIMRLIDANETSDLFLTVLDCTGLMRLFYFPLCLTFFYHTILLAGLGLIVVVLTAVTRFVSRSPIPATANRPFPWGLLLPLLIAYLVLGEYFSFGMDTKTMRSLLLVLPPAWLLVFALAERCRVHHGAVVLAVIGYVGIAYIQVFTNAFPCDIATAEGYQLEDDWLTRFPAPLDMNRDRALYTREVLDTLHQNVPPGGKIAVSTERIYWTAESLSWFENSEFLLHGFPPIYEFNNFIRADGLVYRRALLGSSGVMLYTYEELEYSPEVYELTFRMLFYCQSQAKPGGMVASIIPLAPQDLGAIGYLVVFNRPLDLRQVDSLVKGSTAFGYAVDEEQFSALHDHRLSWAECREILWHWISRHLGSSSSAP